MKKPIITILQYLFFLGLGILFVWLSVREIKSEQWLQIKTSLQKAKVWLIVPVFITLMLSHLSRAIRWKILMQSLNYKPSTLNTFAAVMIGYLVNAGVPRLGEVVKCTLLSKYEKVRADKLIGTIVVERAVDVFCLAVVFVLALLFQGHIVGDFVQSLLGNFFQNKGGQTSLTKILVYGGSLFVVLLLIFILFKRFNHTSIIAKIKNVAAGIWHGLQSIRYIKQRGWFIFHSVFIWAMYLLSTTLGIYALQETA